MKSVCIKTNDTNSIKYLLNELEHIDLENICFTIRDFKHYNQSLIKEDISLSHEIEDYLKRREIAEQQHRDKMLAKEQGLEYIETTDEDMQEHLENIAQQKEETRRIIEGLEDGEEE